MPQFQNYQEFVDHFQGALGLGDGAVMKSEQTGRPYVKIAQKGDATLLVNVSLCHITSQKHGNVVGVQIRFHQRGGLPTAFDPVLKARENTGNGYRLSKIEFPLCPISGSIDAVESWKKQNVTEQLHDWVKSIIQFTSATPVSDAALIEIIELLLPSKKAVEEFNGKVDLFDLNDKEVETAPASLAASETPVLFGEEIDAETPDDEIE